MKAKRTTYKKKLNLMKLTIQILNFSKILNSNKFQKEINQLNRNRFYFQIRLKIKKKS
jgi:hypothetical protein